MNEEDKELLEIYMWGFNDELDGRTKIKTRAMAKNILNYNEIIEQARSSWGGSAGDKRAESVKQILDSRLDNYSQVTGISKEDILQALERKRGVNTVNFYQESNLPLLEDGVMVFETIADFTNKFQSGKSICPKCEKESTDYYECTQQECDWKVYGLFGSMGKGIKVIIKERFMEHPVPVEIFKPIEIAEL